jgi:hypothetical protein
LMWATLFEVQTTWYIEAKTEENLGWYLKTYYAQSFDNIDSLPQYYQIWNSKLHII